MDGEVISVGAIIQARMKSTRLPGKVLMALPFGTSSTILDWITREVKRSQVIRSAVIATSTDPSNDPIEDYARYNNMPFVRASEDDVLSRFVTAIEQHGFTHIVRLTGDNPLIDISIIDQVIERHINNCSDYTCTTGLPIGMNVEVIRSSALLDSFGRNDISDADREHVTLYVKRSGHYKTDMVQMDFTLSRDDVRLTVDYPGDFAALNLILQSSGESKHRGMELVQYIDRHYPWIWEINCGQIQKKV